LQHRSVGDSLIAHNIEFRKNALSENQLLSLALNTNLRQFLLELFSLGLSFLSSGDPLPRHILSGHVLNGA
jgi:hypothetical protein